MHRSIPLRISRSFEASIYIYKRSKHVYSDSLYVSIVERLHFLQVAPITSAIYFSQAISARRAISAWPNELRDRWAMHPVFADRKRSSEIRSSRILEPLFSITSPLSSSISCSLFLSSHSARDHSHVSRAIFPSANRYRSRSCIGTLRWNCAIRLTPLRDRYVASRSRSALLLLARIDSSVASMHPRGPIFIGKLR